MWTLKKTLEVKVPNQKVKFYQLSLIREWRYRKNPVDFNFSELDDEKAYSIKRQKISSKLKYTKN